MAFVGVGAEVLDSLTNEMYEEIFDGISDLVDDDPAVTLWEMQQIVLDAPQIEDGRLICWPAGIADELPEAD